MNSAVHILYTLCTKFVQLWHTLDVIICSVHIDLKYKDITFYYLWMIVFLKVFFYKLANDIFYCLTGFYGLFLHHMVFMYNCGLIDWNQETDTNLQI